MAASDDTALCQAAYACCSAAIDSRLIHLISLIVTDPANLIVNSVTDGPSGLRTLDYLTDTGGYKLNQNRKYLSFI